MNETFEQVAGLFKRGTDGQVCVPIQGVALLRAKGGGNRTAPDTRTQNKRSVLIETSHPRSRCVPTDG